MKDFDSLKTLWEQAGDDLPPRENKHVQWSNQSRNYKLNLQNHQLRGALMLILTGLLIIAMALFADFNFKSIITYTGMYLIAGICFVQAILLLFTWQKIKKIDETQPPRQHLQQWEAYYNFRQKQIKWNMPLYFIFLNLAMGIYLIEIFQGRPLTNVLIFTGIYLGWMLFAYFYLGKRVIRKEEFKLKTIMDNLKQLEAQLAGE